MHTCTHAFICIYAYMQRYIYTCTYACVCWYMHEIHTYIHIRMHTSLHTHDHNLYWQQSSVSNPLPFASLSSTNPEPAALIKKTSKTKETFYGQDFCSNCNARCKGGKETSARACHADWQRQQTILSWVDIVRIRRTMNIWTCACMYVCMHVCICVYMYVCVYVCM